MQGSFPGTSANATNYGYVCHPQQTPIQTNTYPQQNVYSQSSTSIPTNSNIQLYGAQSQPIIYQQPYTPMIYPMQQKFMEHTQQPYTQTHQTGQPLEFNPNLHFPNASTQQPQTTRPATPPYTDIELDKNLCRYQQYDTQSVTSEENKTLQPNDFQEVKPRKKRKRSINSPQEVRTEHVKTRNRFQPFAAMDSAGESNTNQNSLTKQNKENVPPFILHFVEKIPPLVNLLNSVVTKKDYYYEILKGNKVKIQANTLENYKKIKKTLDEHKVIRHTYTLDENKKFRVVLRNVHHSTSHDEIITALKELGHTVVNVTGGSTANKYGSTKNIFFIDLEKQSNNSDIFKIKLLLNAVVQFEEPKKKSKLIQCMRCCCYGHTKNNCTRPPRCYKCAGSHDYTTCNKRKDDGRDPKCALCGGTHPATAKICKVYQEIVSRRFPSYNIPVPETLKDQRVQQHQQQKQQYQQQQEKLCTSTNPVTYNQQQVTYAQATSGNNIIAFLQTTITNQQQTMNQMAIEIKSLREQLSQLTSLLLKNGAVV